MKKKNIKYKNKNKNKHIIALIILLSILLVLLFNLSLYNKEPIIKKYDYSNEYKIKKVNGLKQIIKNVHMV